MNRLGMNYVRARVSGNTAGIYTPVLNGQQVSLCEPEEVKKALGLTDDDVKNPLVCGYLEMYKGEDKIKIRVILDSHFLIGPDGAHINISGISGLAAKTSYSMFLLRAIQSKFPDGAHINISGISGLAAKTSYSMFLLRAIQSKFRTENGDTCAFVFFNVKGRDLMAIDEPNQGLSSEDKQIYSDLGLTDTPFENVRYYYPYSKSDVAKVQSYAAPSDIEQQKRDKKAFTYKFTFADNKDKLDLLLANEEDPTNTLEACANFIMNEEGKFKNIEKWETLKAVLLTRRKKFKLSAGESLRGVFARPFLTMYSVKASLMKLT